MSGQTLKRGYCFRCDEEQLIHHTVPWQDNTCSTCGSTEVRIEE